MKTLMTISVNDAGDLVLILPRSTGDVSNKPCLDCGETIRRLMGDVVGTGSDGASTVPNCPNDGAIYDLKCQNGLPRWVVAAEES